MTGQGAGGFSGAVLVTRGGRTVLREASGTADARAGTPCEPRSRFQLASVSKQFTAVAALLLAEDGLLPFHTAIARWLPRCPRHWRELTLHQLLTHTAGLPHWWAVPGFTTQAPGDPDDLLDRAARLPLLAAPGTAWHYSSPGYLLAARIMERVTGERHGEFLARRVFAPLGMTATTATTAPREQLARGHRAGNPVDAPRFAALPGTGDVWSTVDDLARFTAALAAGDLLTAGSRTAMTAAHAVPDPGWAADGPVTGTGYGYGLCSGTLAGHRACFHPGDNPGYAAFHAWLPELDATVVVLSNEEETGIGRVLGSVVTGALDGPQPAGGGPSTSARS
jgi:CubicO group peptidase (beta-lactamase class C family)